jgi:hypothetical protein
MGFGIMQCWINGPATDGIDDKINPPAADQRSTIPLLHFRGEFESPNISILSAVCRISETLIVHGVIIDAEPLKADI